MEFCSTTSYPGVKRERVPFSIQVAQLGGRRFSTDSALNNASSLGEDSSTWNMARGMVFRRRNKGPSIVQFQREDAFVCGVYTIRKGSRVQEESLDLLANSVPRESPASRRLCEG